jgi:hypothetical protein
MGYASTQQWNTEAYLPVAAVANNTECTKYMTDDDDIRRRLLHNKNLFCSCFTNASEQMPIIHPVVL